MDQNQKAALLILAEIGDLEPLFIVLPYEPQIARIDRDEVMKRWGEPLASNTNQDEKQSRCMVCATCGGKIVWENCHTCEGTGGYHDRTQGTRRPSDSWTLCTACEGSEGFYICENLVGTGLVKH